MWAWASASRHIITWWSCECGRVTSAPARLIRFLSADMISSYNWLTSYKNWILWSRLQVNNFLPLFDCSYILESDSIPCVLWKEGNINIRASFRISRKWEIVAAKLAWKFPRKQSNPLWYSPPKQTRWIGTDGVPQVWTWYKTIRIGLRFPGAMFLQDTANGV